MSLRLMIIIIAIQISRNSFDGLTGLASKLNTSIAFPLNGLELINENSDTLSSSSVLYDLQSVILHKGHDFRSGHYTTIVSNG